MEEIVLECFPEDKPFMKLVGSSSTGTMRKGHEDLDYAVAFQNRLDNNEFLDKIKDINLNITKIKQNKHYGYIKISGEFSGMKFVLVPMIHPNGKIETYEHDAFYHSELINKLKREDHPFNSILAKEFFSQLGVYKEVKGISIELLILKYRDFDEMLKAFVENDSLRVNFSQNNLRYSTSPLVVDYPYFGGRSFTEKVNRETYSRIQESAIKVLNDPKYLIGSKNDK